jgi:hypothetical protein
MTPPHSERLYLEIDSSEGCSIRFQGAVSLIMLSAYYNNICMNEKIFLRTLIHQSRQQPENPKIEATTVPSRQYRETDSRQSAKNGKVEKG